MICERYTHQVNVQSQTECQGHSGTFESVGIQAETTANGCEEPKARNPPVGVERWLLEATDCFSSHADDLSLHTDVQSATYDTRMPVGKLANIRTRRNAPRT